MRKTINGRETSVCDACDAEIFMSRVIDSVTINNGQEWDLCESCFDALIVALPFLANVVGIDIASYAFSQVPGPQW